MDTDESSVGQDELEDTPVLMPSIAVDTIPPPRPPRSKQNRGQIEPDEEPQRGFFTRLNENRTTVLIVVLCAIVLISVIFIIYKYWSGPTEHVASAPPQPPPGQRRQTGHPSVPPTNYNGGQRKPVAPSQGLTHETLANNVPGDKLAEMLQKAKLAVRKNASEQESTRESTEPPPVTSPVYKYTPPPRPESRPQAPLETPQTSLASPEDLPDEPIEIEDRKPEPIPIQSTPPALPNLSETPVTLSTDLVDAVEGPVDSASTPVQDDQPKNPPPVSPGQPEVQWFRKAATLCIGRTQSGEPCKRRPASGFDKCSFHLK